MENEVLELIIAFVNAVKADNRISSYDQSGNQYSILNCRYLLGQIIRSYEIPSKNYHVSEAAMDLWNRLSSADILEFYYDKKIECDRADRVQVNKYKGNAKTGTPTTIMRNEKLKFNDVFHEEHTVTIRTITGKLLSEKNLTCERAKWILDHMHICRILKDEDRRIVQTSKRPFDYEEVIRTVYNPVGIVILDEAVV